MKLRDHYEPVNNIFPQTLPPLTRIEAERASNRIMRHFTKRGFIGRIRTCWIAVSEPYNGLSRGWRRLAHDLSHRIMYRRGWSKPHSGVHAKLELEIIEYILDKGWLAGTLKPIEVVKYIPSVSDKLAHVRSLMAQWIAKKKRAETAIKKLQRKARYYQSRVIVRADSQTA